MTVVYQGQVLNGTFHLIGLDLTPLGSKVSPDMQKYLGGYKDSIQWLASFASKPGQSLTAPYWGKIAAIGGSAVAPSGPATVTVPVPAGTSKSVNTTAAMNFALTPFTGVAQISTSSDIPTNTGSIHAALSWSPNPLVPNTPSKVNITFYDPTGTAPLTGMNIKYNLIIYDKNNHPIITKNNLIAKGATDTQSITFPAAQTYHMQVQITQLVKPGQTPDLTRNGVATGYVVVPEFPSYLSVSLLMAVMIGAVVFMQSRKKLFYASDTGL